MALSDNSSTVARREHHGHWVHSQRDHFCESCGWHITMGEWFLFFPWFPGRQHRVVCIVCALGPVTPATSLHAPGITAISVEVAA